MAPTIDTALTLHTANDSSCFMYPPSRVLALIRFVRLLLLVYLELPRAMLFYLEPLSKNVLLYLRETKVFERLIEAVF